MFADAIEKVAQFTRPVNTIMRTYGSDNIIPGSATLFFLNEEGYALTCRHVLELLFSSDKINKQYQQFGQEKNALPPADPFNNPALRNLEEKYKYYSGTAIQLKVNFIDCVDQMSGFTWFNHPTLDLAIIKFNGFNKRMYNEPAVFIKDTKTIRPGTQLCRLGFPFPEFTNFAYNAATDDIVWTQQGVTQTPRFPIDGMVTRFLGAFNQPPYGIELSTPGLRGQSGGPLFDEKGLVCGMQFSTKHMYLGFDIENKPMMINNQIKNVSDYSFMHLGQCIHVEAIKAFLNEHKVKFYEA